MQKNSYLLQETDKTRIRPFPHHSIISLFDCYCKNIMPDLNEMLIVYHEMEQTAIWQSNPGSSSLTHCSLALLNDHLLQCLYVDCIHLHQTYN